MTSAFWRFVAWFFGKVSRSAQAMHDDFHETPVAGCRGCAIRSQSTGSQEPA